jgi:hypothetical protein
VTVHCLDDSAALNDSAGIWLDTQCIFSSCAGMCVPVRVWDASKCHVEHPLLMSQRLHLEIWVRIDQVIGNVRIDKLFRLKFRFSCPWPATAHIMSSNHAMSFQILPVHPTWYLKSSSGQIHNKSTSCNVAVWYQLRLSCQCMATMKQLWSQIHALDQEDGGGLDHGGGEGFMTIGMWNM